MFVSRIINQVTNFIRSVIQIKSHLLGKHHRQSGITAQTFDNLHTVAPFKVIFLKGNQLAYIVFICLKCCLFVRINIFPEKVSQIFYLICICSILTSIIGTDIEHICTLDIIQCIFGIILIHLVDHRRGYCNNLNVIISVLLIRGLCYFSIRIGFIFKIDKHSF